jgi:Tol biopolymer transport system component
MRGHVRIREGFVTPFSKIPLIVLALSIAALAGASAAHAVPGMTTLVSIASTGEQVMGAGSQQPAVSADGRFVTFITDASNVVSGDTNFAFDVFLRDRLTGETTRVSVSSTGAEGDSNSDAASISADGRFVALTSAATNLVPGDTNHASDVLVRDRLTGVTERVSVSSAGDQGDGPSGSPSISADGRFVTFASNATNLVPGDTNFTLDIFLRDRLTASTTRVSVSSLGEQANRFSELAVISADGRFVAFQSFATNLVPGDTNNGFDVFVHELATATTERISVSSTGAQGDLSGFNPSISADGRFVAFSANATNLVAGDTNGTVDAFVRDRANATTERVSLSTTGAEANDRCDLPSISADGTRIAFQSLSSTLVARDTNGLNDVFVRDRTTGETRRVSVFTPSPTAPGLQVDGNSMNPAMSADGRLVAFDSDASRLVIGDRNGWRDVFAHELR